MDSNIVRCPKCGMRRLRTTIVFCPGCGHRPWTRGHALLLVAFLLYLVCLGVIAKELLQ